MKNLLVLFFTLFTINHIYADSPLTSTDFYKAYLEEPIVTKALKTRGKITEEILVYLTTDSNSLEIKLALINAVGWNYKGSKNSELFLKKVLANKKYKKETSNYISLKYYGTSSEQICYAYLKALDNYFDVIDAYEMANTSLKNNPNSFAITMIASLIKAQTLVAIDETCYACKQFAALKNDQNKKMDMKEESLIYIFEYMDSINTNCN